MGGVQKTTLLEVQQIQEQAATLAVGHLHPRDSNRKNQARLGWLTISNEVELATHVMTWKTINFGIPEEVSWLMPLNTTGRRIQQQRKLATKPKILDKSKSSRFSFRARSYKYNTLPGDITKLQTLSKFKKAVKSHLMWK